MITFLYRGLNEDFSYVFGSGSYLDRRELEKKLETSNLTSIEIFESKTPHSNKKHKFVNQKDLSIFCKQLSVIFLSYVTIMDGILLISEQTDNKVLKTTLFEIHSFLERGYSISDAFAMYPHIFDSYLLQMINIGEQSGTLDLVFENLSNYYEKDYEIRRKVRTSILYPLSLSAVTCIMFYYLANSVLPLFDSILVSLGGEMSGITKNIMAFNDFVTAYLLIILFIIFTIIGLIFIYFSKEKGQYKLDKFKATAPYISFVTNRIITARFSRSLSLLLKSGIDIHTSIEKSSVLITNKYIMENYSIAKKSFMEGESLSSSLKQVNAFPSLFIKMVSIGETSGNLYEMLSKTTSVFEDEAYGAINKLTKLIEPLLITILTFVMGFLLITVMMPMITIMNTM